MDSPNKKVYSFANDIGDAAMTRYDVFPGIQLIYNSVHMDQLEMGSAAKGNLIEIYHCREGRIEQEFQDEFFYLMPGDLSIAIRSEAVKAFHFPLRHYHGITITIDTDVTPACFSAFLDGVTVSPMEVARTLCGARCSRVLRGETYIEHLFSQLYSVPEHIRIGYLRVKVLELLLVLRGITPQDTVPPAHALSRYQVQLAKRAAAYLWDRKDQHVTIQELAKRFSVSDTYLKTAFKGVYGVPVFSYMRLQKMQAAAQLLIHTDRAIADIGAEVGYGTAGKFSIAFRGVMGETPSEYRRAHAKRAHR